MPDALPRIFISYARADSTAFVDRLERDLKAQQFHPWVDRHGLEGGDEWLEIIQDVIDSCQALVVILSPAAVQSEYVHMEYHYAKEEGKPVIPVMWRSVKIPMDLRLTHCIDFQTSYEEGLRQLMQALSRLNAPAAQNPAPSPAQQTKAAPPPAQPAQTPAPQPAQQARPATPQLGPSKPKIGTILLTYKGHKGSVYAVDWSPDGTRIASGSSDNTVQVWDVATGKNFVTYRGHSHSIHAIAWSPDGTRIASAAYQTVQVWDAATGDHLSTYAAPFTRVSAIAWSSDSTRIAAGSDDKTVQVWDAASGRPLITYRNHAAEVNAVVWSPDGTRIASGGQDSTVQVWDAASGSHLLTCKASSVVLALAWSPDSKGIASATWKTIERWDAQSSKLLAAYEGHRRPINAVVWSPDGTRIASASQDGTVRLWDVAIGRFISLDGGYSTAIAWSPDGTRIASDRGFNMVQVWQAV